MVWDLGGHRVRTGFEMDLVWERGVGWDVTWAGNQVDTVGTGLQMEFIWVWGLRWDWDVVWHPGVKQLKSTKDKEGQAAPEH